MDKQVLTTIKVLLTTLAFSLVLFVLYKLAPIFALLLISLFVVLALEPAVKYFKSKIFMNKPIPRGFAVALTFALFIFVILLVLTVGLPPVIAQAQKLITNLAGVFEGVPGFENVDISLGTILPQAGDITDGILSTTFSVFSNVLGIFSVVFLSLYMSLDWENIKSRFFELFHSHAREETEQMVQEVESNIGHWVKGQLLLMLIVGAASFFGLLFLGVDYPLAIGLIAGLFEIVPVLGPVLSAVLAAIVGFAMSPVKGFAVIILFIIIQQLENNLLVPKIMQKVSGFSPLVILIALLVGSNFFGVIGAIVAVPLMMIGVMVVRRLLTYKK